MKNDKSPGNDGLTKEFYETFLEEIKTPLSNLVRKYFLAEELSTSQKQAFIKLQPWTKYFEKIKQNFSSPLPPSSMLLDRLYSCTNVI